MNNNVIFLRNCFCLGNCSCSNPRYSVSGGEYCNERGSSESFLSKNSTNPFRNPLDNCVPSSLATPLTPTKVCSAENSPITQRRSEHKPTECPDQIECSPTYLSPLPVLPQKGDEQLVDIVAGPDELLVKFTNCQSNGTSRFPRYLRGRS